MRASSHASAACPATAGRRHCRTSRASRVSGGRRHADAAAHSTSRARRGHAADTAFSARSVRASHRSRHAIMLPSNGSLSSIARETERAGGGGAGDAGAAAGLDLDEPCRDGLEGGPPEMADGRVLPVRVKHGARQRPQFGKRIIQKRPLRKGPQERRQRIMHQIAAERRIDRPVQIVFWAQLQNTLGVY